jgi:hypothetical protein
MLDAHSAERILKLLEALGFELFAVNCSTRMRRILFK